MPYDPNRLFQLPLPGMATPSNLAFSPDDHLITYLYSPQQNLVNQLFAFDIATQKEFPLVVESGVTEESLSQEEKLRRERLRQMTLGITQYAWAEKVNRLLIPIKNSLCGKDSPSSPLRILVPEAEQAILSAKLSPDGEWVAYVQDGEIYVVPFSGGQPKQITHGARDTGKTHGLAEYIAQEEMERYDGFWWSPDSQWIAFTKVDETHIPLYRIVHQGKGTTGEGSQEDHHYPFAGQSNAKVKVGIVSRDGGEPIWMESGTEEDEYLARVQWFSDDCLFIQCVDRSQSILKVWRHEPQTGRRTLLLCEHNKTWINLHHICKPLKQEDFIWASERTGYRHLYLYNKNGDCIHQITEGDWMVDQLLAVDEDRGDVYFTGTLDSPLEVHLYRVPLSGGTPRRITQKPGIHTVVIDHAKERFIDTVGYLSDPPAISLHSLKDGSPINPIYSLIDPRIPEFNLKPPQIVTIKNRHGDLLFGAVYYPPLEFGSGPHPTIVSVYGGPHAQMITSNWLMTVAMRAQYLSSLGYLVFALDNRGSFHRGLAFEGIIKNDLGHYEVEDQVDGVRWLVSQGLTDPKRVGIYGWSYGGYMALMCLCRAPDTFHAAVAGAPVTHWDGYDTFYTERYMGTPRSNPKGYEQSSVMKHVERITGELMIVHGLIDENVHFRHTARLINALVQVKKPYELLLFPDERHMPRNLADRIYMEERIVDFFMKSLGCPEGS